MQEDKIWPNEQIVYEQPESVPENETKNILCDFEIKKQQQIT